MLGEFYNLDCMAKLPEYPDGHFDLAIVDPPYGIGRFGDRVEIKKNKKSLKINTWDKKPAPEYWRELFRVSKRRIIWGANNFTLPETEYFIVWDKMQSVTNFASAEYAWTDVKKPAQIFRFPWAGSNKGNGRYKIKIHPTMKPTELYKWLLTLYAEPGYLILDTHVGSASSLIACEDLGFKYVGFELDAEYFQAASERLAAHKDQMRFFNC